MNTADAIKSSLISVNEADRNMEAANVVDGLFAIARAVERLSSAVETLQCFPEERGPTKTLHIPLKPAGNMK